MVKITGYQTKDTSRIYSQISVTTHLLKEIGNHTNFESVLVRLFAFGNESLVTCRHISKVNRTRSKVDLFLRKDIFFFVNLLDSLTTKSVKVVTVIVVRSINFIDKEHNENTNNREESRE